MKSQAAGQRVQPLQARGVRRVEAILDAASTLLAEVGYEAMTLTAVAERSGSAIPSLYRFFANKDELIDALADRVAARIRGAAEDVLDVSTASVPITVFVGNLVDRIGEVVIDFPCLGEILGRFEARNYAVDVEIAQRFEQIVKARAPHLPRSERAAIVLMAMLMIRSSARVMATAGRQRRASVARELATALEAYLSARTGADRSYVAGGSGGLSGGKPRSKFGI